MKFIFGNLPIGFGNVPNGFIFTLQALLTQSLVMKKHQISILDIAKELGISKSTVSRALLSHPNVKEGTRNAVLELAAKRDYQRNSLALGLARQKTSLIGILVPDITGSFFSSVITGAQEALNKKGYNVIVCISNENYETEVENVKLMVSQQVDGIIASHTKETRNFDHFKMVERRGIALTMFTRVTDQLNVPKVMVDDYQAAFAAVEHLLKKGRRRIAHLAGPDTLINSKLRLQGYLDALKKYKVPVDNNLIISYDLSLEKVRIYMKHFLELSSPPNALFAMNDPTAVAAMQVIKEKGLRIPKDIAVVGFSNNLSSEQMTPSLTTVAQPTFEIGRESASLLLEEIDLIAQQENHADLKRKTIILKTQFLVRESS